eukprot:462306_1
MKHLTSFISFCTLWIFLSYNIHFFWFGMVILFNKSSKVYLFEDTTDKNISLPSQISTAVITTYYEQAAIDITTTEGVRHGMDIITAVCVEQYAVYCAQVYTNLVTDRYFNMLEICYTGNMQNKTDIKQRQAKEYWIFVEILYDTQEYYNVYIYQLSL